MNRQSYHGALGDEVRAITRQHGEEIVSRDNPGGAGARSAAIITSIMERRLKRMEPPWPSA